MLRQLVSRGLIVLSLAGAGAAAAPLTAQAASAHAARPLSTRSAHTMYTVRRGDTFSSIARRFHTTVPKLESLNRKRYPAAVANPRKLRTGSRLTVR